MCVGVALERRNAYNLDVRAATCWIYQYILPRGHHATYKPELRYRRDGTLSFTISKGPWIVSRERTFYKRHSAQNAIRVGMHVTWHVGSRGLIRLRFCSAESSGCRGENGRLKFPLQGRSDPCDSASQTDQKRHWDRIRCKLKLVRYYIIPLKLHEIWSKLPILFYLFSMFSSLREILSWNNEYNNDS